jgi:hypothetical protein
MGLARPAPSDYAFVIGGGFGLGPPVGRGACLRNTGCARFRPLGGGAAMTEDPIIIQMNIDRYRSMLTLHLNAEERFRVERLLVEATGQLTLATGLKNQ